MLNLEGNMTVVGWIGIIQAEYNLWKGEIGVMIEDFGLAVVAMG